MGSFLIGPTISGDEQAVQGGQGGAGWGAYLHRWSGLTWDGDVASETAKFSDISSEIHKHITRLILSRAYHTSETS